MSVSWNWNIKQFPPQQYHKIIVFKTGDFNVSEVWNIFLSTQLRQNHLTNLLYIMNSFWFIPSFGHNCWIYDVMVTISCWSIMCTVKTLIQGQVTIRTKQEVYNNKVQKIQSYSNLTRGHLVILRKIAKMHSVCTCVCVCSCVLRSYLVRTSRGRAESEAAALSWPARSIWPALPETESATAKTE